MIRAAHILGLSASLSLCNLGLTSDALAGPGDEPIEVLPPASEVEPPPRPEPPRGRKLYAAGIFGVVFGVFNIGYGIPLSITGPGDAYFSGTIPIVFGASFIVLGAVGIHYGKRRKKVWRAWQEDPSAPPLDLRRPPQPKHVPWLIVGGVTTALGLATIAVMLPEHTDPVLNTPDFAYGVTTWGAASAAAGVAMLTVGAVHASRARRGAARVELRPTQWARRDGFGFGVAGRF